jgi:uncharacterized protein
MKQNVTMVLLALQLGAAAQTKAPGQQLYRDGTAYLQGVTKPYDPQRAKALLGQAAALGEGPAMVALGQQYQKGEGTKALADSALYWYGAAAQQGQPMAYYHLGNLYNEGRLVAQNFAKATGYYAKGAAQGHDACAYMTAYLHYKGLGVAQNYATAFVGFMALAQKGVAPAYYFLALCYRNGYGTTVDKEQANFWLQKAAAMGDGQAKQELREPQPENISTASPHLQQQLVALTGYQEKFAPANNNNYEGDYTGHIVYYDWSRRYVSDIQPLRISLSKTGSGYAGEWQEGDAPANSIALSAKGGQLVFDSNCAYERINHYSGRKPERWQFNSAQLQLGFSADSIVLNGAVQFYSMGRREPGKPVQVILKRAMGDIGEALGQLSIKLLPNPATANASVQFTLLQTAKVMVKLATQDGKVLFVENEKKLPVGTYTYTLPIGAYAKGSYWVQVYLNGKSAATQTLVKL